MNAYLSMYKNIFNYSGCTSRKDYWTAVLIHLPVMALLDFILIFCTYSLAAVPEAICWSGIFLTLFITFIASLPLTVRRLHSINKSGWYYLISFIPAVGTIALFVLTLLKEHPLSENRYGPYTSTKKFDATEILEKEISKTNEQIYEQSNRKENDFGHKLALKDTVQQYATETDLNNFIFMLKDETAESYVEKRIQFALSGFAIMMLALVVVTIVNFVFKLRLAINYPLFLIASTALTYIVYKLDYIMLKSAFRKKQTAVKDAFPLWMSTLEILIVTNNIPNTLKKSLISCPDVLREDLEAFIKKIEVNPIDKDAYVSFLSEYNIPEIQEIVLDLYQFNFVEKNNISAEFSALHNRLNRLKSDTRKRRQSSEIFMIGALNSVPLMCLAIYILMISNLLSSALMGSM